MKYKNKILLIVLTFVLSLFIICFILCYFTFLHKYKGKTIEYNWTPSDEFKIENIKTIQKQKDQDFVILNLADIQLADSDFFKFDLVHKEITELVETVKPDLITLTGDQVWSNENLLSLSSIISWLDEYQIPYAPVFGNHDYGNHGDEAVSSMKYSCDLYEQGKYSLFDRGPSNIGKDGALGNYVINIMEDDKIYKTLYMIDSGYSDIITDEQIAWFKWVADGIKQYNNNEYSEAMCFFHKPLPEFRMAYLAYEEGLTTSIGDIYYYFSLSGSDQNNFFDIAKECGVKDFVCGHQHGNCFTINYEGARLSFALKTSETCSYVKDNDIYLNGGTYFILNDNVTIKHLFVSYEKYHFSDKNNVVR